MVGRYEYDSVNSSKVISDSSSKNDSIKPEKKLSGNIGDISDYSPSELNLGGGIGNVLSAPQALQLVIGKTMREELGEEVAVSFCKNIRCGQLVLISGRLGIIYIYTYCICVLHGY